ncbi:HlyIII-domain-containing protein [Decorospora gaudefroyi]|uniref:HlyIII-domain-containing protein n=1 Tax=Decorospora gaudefroyi TaxID=184978 RepID=A0A6A5K806_9PLEO|nr:HlyIII-domain-containing protein [Decorospora gaudefroyi]
MKNSPPQKKAPSPAELSNPYGLLCYDQLPEWRKDNPYIYTQYRPISHSYKACLKSLFYLHNQTGNIYSHLLFFFPVLALIIHNSLALAGVRTLSIQPRSDDVLAFSAFFAGAAMCMSFSTAYHTFMSHSEYVASRGKLLDFAGITCLIWGSMMPTLYYAFNCETDVMKKYMVTFSTFGVMALLYFLSPLASNPTAQKMVIPLFVIFAASGILPLAHGVQLYGWDRMDELVGLKYVLLHGAIYAASLGPFLTKFPECWLPGKCDMWFSSHQIFHVAIVLAASVHFLGLIKAFQFQHAHTQMLICPLLNTWKGDVLHVL